MPETKVGPLVVWKHETSSRRDQPGRHGDDIVGVKHLTMNLGAATKSYYDWTELLATPRPTTFHMDFKGDGGHYRVGMYYQLSKS